MINALQGGEGGQKFLGLRVLEPKWHHATLALIENTHQCGFATFLP